MKESSTNSSGSTALPMEELDGQGVEHIEIGKGNDNTNGAESKGEVTQFAEVRYLYDMDNVSSLFPASSVNSKESSDSEVDPELIGLQGIPKTV